MQELNPDTESAHKFGFIMTRHVNSELTNQYWNRSLFLLKTLYPSAKVVIIDDYSNPTYLKTLHPHLHMNDSVIVVQSEFKGAGELLPYYYFKRNKYFENAVIIHDSVFFHKRFPFEKLEGEKVIPLWHFNADRENLRETLRICNYIRNNGKMVEAFKLGDTFLSLSQLKWYGCFGCQAYINHSFLLTLDAQYNLTSLVTIIKSRAQRCCLERILGYLFSSSNTKRQFISLLGDIMKYPEWQKYNYPLYIKDVNASGVKSEIVKIWTGR
jgi:hypothetical protein